MKRVCLVAEVWGVCVMDAHGIMYAHGAKKIKINK